MERACKAPHRGARVRRVDQALPARLDRAVLATALRYAPAPRRDDASPRHYTGRGEGYRDRAHAGRRKTILMAGRGLGAGAGALGGERVRYVPFLLGRASPAGEAAEGRGGRD